LRLKISSNELLLKVSIYRFLLLRKLVKHFFIQPNDLIFLISPTRVSPFPKTQQKMSTKRTPTKRHHSNVVIQYIWMDFCCLWLKTERNIIDDKSAIYSIEIN